MDNLEVNDRDVKSNFEPGEYMEEMFFFLFFVFQSVTQSAGKKNLEYSQQAVHISMNNKHFCSVKCRLMELTISYPVHGRCYILLFVIGSFRKPENIGSLPPCAGVQ